MSTNTVFTEYPEITSDTNSTTKKSDCNKKFKKQLKKQNRLLKRLLNLIEHRRTAAKQPAPEETHTQKNSFLTKLGDAFVKALPAILSTVTTAIIGYFATKLRTPACSASR